MGGNNGGEKGKGFQEHLQRRHGQNQKGVGSRMGGGDGWSWGGMVRGKWRQLYLNNNKKLKKKNF